MKLILLPWILIVLLQTSGLAQDAKSPKPPGYCKPCLFYGGDFSSSQNVNGVANEEDILVKTLKYWFPLMSRKRNSGTRSVCSPTTFRRLA
jgi:hypothetical protein